MTNIKVIVQKATQATPKDVNIPIIHLHQNDKFPVGTYPIQIRHDSHQLVLTCCVRHDMDKSQIELVKQYKPNFQTIASLEDYNDHVLDGIIYIAGTHRWTLKIVQNEVIWLARFDEVCRLDPQNMPTLVVEITKIPPSKTGKQLMLSKPKMAQILKSQLKNICINTDATYVFYDDDIRNLVQLSIYTTTYCQSPQIICYDGEDIIVSSINLNRDTNTKCILTEDTANQSLEILQRLNLPELGIGGLNSQITELLRRVFASRACQPEMIEALGLSHVKGVLLYGPPGTGKTLIARQLGKMLGSVPPIIINGPEVLSKYVGESEENVRRIFQAAEEEYRSRKEQSKLHVIIFDEFDAIAGKRSSGESAGSRVGNQIVNQLLAKMDGVDPLNNILIFGLTNRKELIDEALLRPGRFEVQLEVSIPDEKGRHEIFQIHLAKAQQKGTLSPDVKIESLVKKTNNFTGAEIAGVVRNAITYAIYRQINQPKSRNPFAKAKETPFQLDKENNITILPEDLYQSIEDIQPLFGEQKEILDTILPPHFQMKQFSSQTRIIKKCSSLIQNYLSDKRDFESQSVKILLVGSVGSGKTLMSVHLARQLPVSNIIYLSNYDLIGQSDLAKATLLKSTFIKAEATPASIIILDDIDNIMEISDTKRGFMFNNTILQTLKTLISRAISNRLIFIMTATQLPLLDDLGLIPVFNSIEKLSGR